MYMQQLRRHHLVALALGLVVALLLPIIYNLQIHAAGMTNTLVRFDTMKAGQNSTGTVCAKPSSTATEASVRVTFPSGYTVSTTNGDWTVDTTNTAWPSGASAWTGIGTATAAASQTVTFPSGDLTPGSLYCFNWTTAAALTVGAAGTDQNGTVATYDSGPAQIDLGSYATSSITDDTIVVTATVNPTFSMALSANNDSLGTLTTTNPVSSPTPRTVTVNTNAKYGWQAWARDATTGLHSTAVSYTIGSTTPGTVSTLANNTEGYNMGVSKTDGGAGTITVATAFDKAATAYKGGGLDTSLRTIATSNGNANNAILTLTNSASINFTTPAATDYTDTITVVAAGLF